MINPLDIFSIHEGEYNGYEDSIILSDDWYPEDVNEQLEEMFINKREQLICVTYSYLKNRSLDEPFIEYFLSAAEEDGEYNDALIAIRQWQQSITSTFLCMGEHEYIENVLQQRSCE